MYRIYFYSYLGGYTRTDLALLEAYNMLASAGNRQDVPDVIVVITDGETNNGGKEKNG